MRRSLSLLYPPPRGGRSAVQSASPAAVPAPRRGPVGDYVNGNASYHQEKPPSGGHQLARPPAVMGRWPTGRCEGGTPAGHHAPTTRRRQLRPHPPTDTRPPPAEDSADTRPPRSHRPRHCRRILPGTGRTSTTRPRDQARRRANPRLSRRLRGPSPHPRCVSFASYYGLRPRSRLQQRAVQVRLAKLHCVGKK